MTIETLDREFRYGELKLGDPNARLSIDEVRLAFAATYPEMATATVTGPEAVLQSCGHWPGPVLICCGNAKIAATLVQMAPLRTFHDHLCSWVVSAIFALLSRR